MYVQVRKPYKQSRISCGSRSIGFGHTYVPTYSVWYKRGTVPCFNREQKFQSVVSGHLIKSGGLFYASIFSPQSVSRKEVVGYFVHPYFSPQSFSRKEVAGYFMHAFISPPGGISNNLNYIQSVKVYLII